MSDPTLKPASKLAWWTPAALLLFIYSQMISALVLSAGEFIDSGEAVISPFRFCLVGQTGLSCDGHPGHTGAVVVILCLYSPLVLVAFALLAWVFAAGCGERGVAWLSVACQAASSLLILTGLLVFGGLYWSYVRFADMTACYYTCVCAHAELALTAMLTSALGRRL